MIIHKGYGIAGLDIDNCILEYGSKVISRAPFTCLVEIHVQRYIKESRLVGDRQS